MKNQKLFLARKARKITQADIAVYLKISQTQYQKREVGKIEISASEWLGISKLLGVCLEEIYEPYTISSTKRYADLQQEVEALKQQIKNLKKDRE
jgi:transcriptional regulator with XRE-family HTH domain